MSSEWLKVMMEEIALKKAQTKQALDEDLRRLHERTLESGRSSDDGAGSDRRQESETPGVAAKPRAQGERSP